ncbi:ABC transporter permease [Natronosporangium hydrolyticum]|uniref:ABC transporter permease n=1 Tax=Natronosporangium hydrolyticum TaxID=2811111 RepID=A0A895YKA7_9ACTN|nr:ABC transporter permease [Natronosporangium hydrolyticum]QSB15753.1 ABC transporter permease [Natronosporangium hydrolyticum]
MSVAEVAPARGWPRLRLLRGELWLIFGRRRNWAGLAVLAAVPVVIAVAIRIADPVAGAGGPEFFTRITGNGFFVALAALSACLTLFLPLAVAVIAGDAIAGEAHTGTLRYLLTVPVGRTTLLAVKGVAVAAFTVTAVLLIAAVGLLAGGLLFGGGPVTLLSGQQVGLGGGLLRLLLICGYLGVALCALGAVGLFVSTLTEQPIGASIAVLMLTMASFVLDSIPQLAWLHPYLLTHWWTAFGDLLRSPIYLPDLQRGLLSAGAYIVIFWTAAWARFAGRDITS